MELQNMTIIVPLTLFTSAFRPFGGACALLLPSSGLLHRGTVLWQKVNGPFWPQIPGNCLALPNLSPNNTIIWSHLDYNYTWQLMEKLLN